MEKTVCELFAGVGGFRLGFERDSKEWKTVWFSQWEPGKKRQYAWECYRAHWPEDVFDERTGEDISTVDKETIPDHNLLVGGFPCQDYSVAPFSFRGKRNRRKERCFVVADTGYSTCKEAGLLPLRKCRSSS
jgi:DNA (cytosine-5)-methyltransferase 1